MVEKDNNVNSAKSYKEEQHFPLDMKIVDAQPVKNELKSLQR